MGSAEVLSGVVSGEVCDVLVHAALPRRKNPGRIQVILLHLKLLVIESEEDVGHHDIQVAHIAFTLDFQHFLLASDLDEHAQDFDGELLVSVSETACHTEVVELALAVDGVADHLKMHLLFF